MDQGTVLNIVARFKAALADRGIVIKQIVLFGSYATGQQHEGSDIDLVVISPSFAGMTYWERVRVLADAVCEIFEPIEAVPLTPDEWERKESTAARYAGNGEVVG